MVLPSPSVIATILTVVGPVAPVTQPPETTASDTPLDTGPPPESHPLPEALDPSAPLDQPRVPDSAPAPATKDDVESAPTKEAPAVATPVETPAPSPAVAPTPAAPPAPPAAKPELTFGAQAFLRGESRFNPDFDASDGQHDYRVLQRVRLQVGAKYKALSAFVQFQDARTWGFEASTAGNEANTDLHQGFLELGGNRRQLAGWIRAGRQEVSWGTQRLVGSLPWANVARSFDAVRVQGTYGKFGLDAFVAALDLQQTFTVVDESMDPPEETTIRTPGSQLAGAQAFARFSDKFNVEATFLVANLRPSPAAPDRKRVIYNPDLHLSGKPLSGLAYDVEASVQRGEIDGRAHQAWAFAGDLGYNLQRVKAQPGAAVGFAAASGEACADTPENGCGASTSREFFNFYPTNHIHYGLADLFGWRNMRDYEAELNVRPVAPLKVAANYHFFQLQEPNGRWSNAGGANVGAGWDPTNTDRNVGHEVDLFAVYKPSKHFFFQPGYSVFLPVGGGRKLVGQDAQHFAWLWFIATF